MITFTRWSIALLLAALLPALASAQTSSGRELDAGPASAATFLGDTGLWFVSAAEVLPGGVVSAGVQAASEARGEGGTKVTYGAVSVAAGIADRAELFGSWQATAEIDGRQGRGDLLTGAKIGLLSERRGAPLAVAVRGIVKLPTGNDRLGISTGEADVLTEIVASRRFGRAEVTGSTGFVWRGDPDGVDLPNGIRSGLGIAVLAHPSLRLFTEVHGESYRESTAGARLVSAFDTAPTAAAGLSWNVAGAFTVSAGVNRAIGARHEPRGIGAAVRIGYRPGVRRAVVSAAPPLSPDPTTLEPPAPPPLPPTAVTPAPPASEPRVLAFDDVHFDFDRDTLRPEAMPILDRIVSALQEDPQLRLRIEGHTCEIGTAEYNLALGERRASTVREYLVSRGITADRLQTVSFGEERPKHDNGTEATRALNRRAEMHPLVQTFSSR
ncbi:MAG: OmpA family protein [Acidobacteria bacterium]|nr:OmpA family protein [Acidobacteriota bacterium]